MKRFSKVLATLGLSAVMLLGVAATAHADDDHDGWRDRRQREEYRDRYYRDGWRDGNGWRDRDDWRGRDRDDRRYRVHDRDDYRGHDRDRGWRDRDHDGDRH
jgi:hypothetical protein